ncbi:hypothetical protein NSA47_03525 [Irregularibacter muris]|uniref:Uncharacterized protein n=1 Tax=Irregularibacter muris TaxID=1796619 RepID=A0AAE3HCX5_9FIRM|nr:hypothetical protein [Irregularibacter muris]MCR1898060.1 hypothetical protein [Irregularibacter muris]
MKKNKKLKNPSTIIENALLRLSILGLLSLVLVQFSLSNNSIKSIIQNNNEAIAVKESSSYMVKGIVEVEIEKYEQYEKVVFLKNGEAIQDLAIDNNIIKLEVYDGDVIELDTTNYDIPINIKIKNTSENVEIPDKSDTYKSDGNIVYLFKTKIAQQ